MAVLHLTKIDSCPLQEDQLSFALKSWMSVLTDTLNSTISSIETALNGLSQYGLTVPSLTTSEINDISSSAPNGTLWYCTDSSPPVIVAKVNDVLVSLDTSPFP